MVQDYRIDRSGVFLRFVHLYRCREASEAKECHYCVAGDARLCTSYTPRSPTYGYNTGYIAASSVRKAIHARSNWGTKSAVLCVLQERM